MEKTKTYICIATLPLFTVLFPVTCLLLPPNILFCHQLERVFEVMLGCFREFSVSLSCRYIRGINVSKLLFVFLPLICHLLQRVSQPGTQNSVVKIIFSLNISLPTREQLAIDHSSFYWLCSFCLFLMLYSWIHTLLQPYQTTPFTQQYAFIIPPCLMPPYYYKIYFTINIPQLIFLPTERHLGCFQF